LAGVIMETEVWPNLLHEAARAGVPLVLANARLSERSRRKAEQLDVLMRPAAARFAVALAQTDDDARRLAASGVKDVQVLGNLKFDMAPSPALLAAGRAWRAALQRPVLLFAVSREGEEERLLDAWLDAWSRPAANPAPRPRPLLLLVPRHPQRFDAVAALVTARGLTLARRSAWGAEVTSTLPAPAEDTQADVWLGDSLGEMPLYYAVAGVALLGGSFEPLGGQNLIESAACGCPLLMGPHTFNFAQAAELAIEAGAAERVDDIDTAVARALQWLAEPAPLAARAERAEAFAAAHRGAAERMASAVLRLVPEAG
jgi:3-deoxy-D-manno-octulosonic-acid transferase